ncbi:MAG: hypothetical protein BGO87_05315 [Flavobacteriia bacterium 40-80]|nr:MAG: hypothetical protein BGO87_05315 [Flavobacteriia bacterium 40-80]
MRNFLPGLFLLLIFPTVFFAQKTLLVAEFPEVEGIPFVQYTDNGVKKVGDINGYISISPESRFVTLKSFGYYDTTVNVLSLKDSAVIFMRAENALLDEIKIKPGVNPALRIIDNVIANRKKNHPKSDMAYKADTYSKFLFSMDSLFDNSFATNPFQDSLLRRWYNIDTTAMNTAKAADTLQKPEMDSLDKQQGELIDQFFSKSHLMIMENASIKEFMPPYREKETITAYKISGLNSPYLANFANEIQAFSFYDNTFELLGSSYINPIAFGAPKKYAYILEDTILTERGDTTFVIRFLPKVNKNFDALYGQLYINTSTWAIEKVIAEPALKGDKIFYIRIIQNYEFIENKKWFPTSLITEFSAPDLKINNKILNGKGFTQVKSIVLNPQLKKRDFNNIIIETEEDAGTVKEDKWKEERTVALTEKEKNTYQTIDSVAKATNLNERIQALEYLLKGKVPIGYINLDLTKIIDYNMYEGYRLGAGIETSRKFSKIVTIGGYFAYGTSDKGWKYGGFTDFLLNKKNNVHLKVAYHDDVLDRGMVDFETKPRELSLRSYYNNFYIRNKEKQRSAKLSIYGKLWSNFQMGAIADYQRLWFTESYQYITDDNKLLQKTDLLEVGTEMIWTPGAKWSLIEGQYFKIKEVFPTVKFKLIKNIPSVSDAFDYWRMRLDISQVHKIYRFGRIEWLLTGSKTIGNAPLFVQNTPLATGGRFHLTIPNSFETMLPNTFYATEYAALFFRWTTESWATKLKFFQPSLSVHHAMGIGRMSDKGRHANALTFHTMEKGYYESGLVVNKILCASTIGLGVGVFYHYGPYSQPKAADNFTYKLSLVISLK